MKTIILSTEQVRLILDAGIVQVMKRGQPYNLYEVLGVRETWHPKRHGWPTGCHYEYKATAEEDGNPTDERWFSPVTMPREAIRLTVKVTGRFVTDGFVTLTLELS